LDRRERVRRRSIEHPVELENVFVEVVELPKHGLVRDALLAATAWRRVGAEIIA
jgi:hypothetical protein